MPEELFFVLTTDGEGGYEATKSYPTFEDAEYRAKNIARTEPNRQVHIVKAVASVVTLPLQGAGRSGRDNPLGHKVYTSMTVKFERNNEAAEEAEAKIQALAARERIVRAAVRYGNAVFSVPPPGRHHHCFALMTSFLEADQADQGFLTSTGRFVDRVEALLIATAAGQFDPSRPNGTPYGTFSPPHQLYSEDLW